MEEFLKYTSEYAIMRDVTTGKRFVRFFSEDPAGFSEDRVLCIDVDGMMFAKIMVENASPEAIEKWLNRRKAEQQNENQDTK